MSVLPADFLPALHHALWGHRHGDANMLSVGGDLEFSISADNPVRDGHNMRLVGKRDGTFSVKGAMR